MGESLQPSDSSRFLKEMSDGELLAAIRVESDKLERRLEQLSMQCGSPLGVMANYLMVGLLMIVGIALFVLAAIPYANPSAPFAFQRLATPAAFAFVVAAAGLYGALSRTTQLSRSRRLCTRFLAQSRSLLSSAKSSIPAKTQEEGQR